MSDRRSVSIHQNSAFVILLAEISLYYSAIFIGGGARFSYDLGAGYPRYALVLTLLVFERCAII